MSLSESPNSRGSSALFIKSCTRPLSSLWHNLGNKHHAPTGCVYWRQPRDLMKLKLWWFWSSYNSIRAFSHPSAGPRDAMRITRCCFFFTPMWFRPVESASATFPLLVQLVLGPVWSQTNSGVGLSVMWTWSQIVLNQLQGDIDWSRLLILEPQRANCVWLTLSKPYHWFLIANQRDAV